MANLTTHQASEIEAIRSAEAITTRASSPGLEKLLHTAFPVLDHGFVRVVDYMGNDEAIVQAARVSYGRGTKRVQEDQGLISYLLRHWHTTPFEMAEIKLHIKLPIFVARQWIRHRTASVNEYSARYSVLDREFYIPAPEHLAAQSTSNRQGRGAILEGREAQQVLDILRKDADQAYDDYEAMLNEPTYRGYRPDDAGLSRELARMNLPLNYYTQWYWKTDLHNLMNFLRLRVDAHAQFEIRAYANAILEIMSAWVPMTYSSFREHRLGAVQLSATGLAVVKKMIAGERPSQLESGLSKREWQELMLVLGLDGEADIALTAS